MCNRFCRLRSFKHWCYLHILLQVNDLKAQLAEQEIELTKKNEEADKLIEIVGIETEKVSKEKAIADEEELKVRNIENINLLN